MPLIKNLATLSPYIIKAIKNTYCVIVIHCCFYVKVMAKRSLRITKKACARQAFFIMAIPRGFEPLTHSLEGCCSIQLSYGTLIKYHKPQKMVGTIGLLKLLLRNFASGKPAIPPYCLFLVVEPTPVGSHPIVKFPIISQRMVGTIGFEPTASCSQSKRSTRLS